MLENLDNNKTQGRIFEIQRFSIHDGHGIRTIVFLKGCVLRCKWCCNPESQEFEIQEMISGGETVTVGEDKSVEEILEIVEKDRIYYRRSGGGITLSGGECLCQPTFAKALLHEAKMRGINTAIESTACTKWEIIKDILPVIDVFLMDIKHVDSAKHRLFTGKENSLILENAKKIAKSNLTELIIRVPVVPTFNCTEKEILDIAYFAEKLKNVNELHLLPYHRLGQDKYEGLRRGYKMKNVEIPTNETMEELKKAVENNTRLKCQIGG